jgi:hypothetical protein
VIETILDWVSIILIVAALIPLVRFVYRFHRYSPWRREAIGRTLMYQKLGMIAILTLALMARVFGEYWLRPWITLAVFIWLVVQFWRTYLELVKTQEAFPYRDNWAVYWAGRRAKKNSPTK